MTRSTLERIARALRDYGAVAHAGHAQARGWRTIEIADCEPCREIGRLRVEVEAEAQWVRIQEEEIETALAERARLQELLTRATETR